MRTLVRNGIVVLPGGLATADILCEDGVITGVLAPRARVSATEEFDASGCLVFPGFIDPHVHSRDPGLTQKEDFAHSSLAALCGGVTTILEMPNALPPVTDAAVFADRAELHARSAWVDFGLWGMALGEENLGALAGLLEAGAVGVKLFWGYGLRRDTQALVYNFSDLSAEQVLAPPENGVVLEIFREVARCGGLLAAHCEDRHILAAQEQELGHPIQTYADFLRARPAIAESTAVAVASHFAKSAECRFHAVHIASEAALSVIRSARASGVPITAETCPQYLTLTDADYEALGPIMKVYPPIRTQADQDALWEAVKDGTVSLIASDHAPHTAEEKARGLASQPAGIVGVETIVPVMLDAMARGRVGPATLARILSEKTARIFGIWPRKGAIAVGSDADLTIVDPAGTYQVDNQSLHSLNPISPWNGAVLAMRPVASFIRGELAMRDNAPVGRPRGRLVRASHGAAAVQACLVAG